MGHVTGLRCRECGADYPQAALHVCEECFGPLEVQYDYDAIRAATSREIIEARPRNLWRYRELLPIDGEPAVGPHSGFTPLVKADRSARALGVRELWVKDDSVNHPTFSYKDRVVSVAISKAIELGFDDRLLRLDRQSRQQRLGARGARRARCFIFIPDNLEQGKVIGSAIYGPRTVAIRGNYDDVNRLCSEIADKYGWAFVNINIRPYYTEGAKTYGFEIAEQLGWRLPQHVVVADRRRHDPAAVAKAFEELRTLGLVDGELPKIYTAQAAGCAPVVRALHAGSEAIPVKPDTIAKSIAIGNPADGYYVLQAVRESGGWGEAATDEEIVDAIQLLARTEGIFTEPAGGTTVAVTRRSSSRAASRADESIVISVTGNGYKTIEAVAASVEKPAIIEARLRDFDELFESLHSPGRQEMVGGSAAAG
jgi:threonine synthase